MSRELSGPVIVIAIAIVLVVVGVAAWHMFGGGSGQLTASAAGLGKPMHPGEIPGKRAGVGMPNAGLPGGR